jgi:hypothetical protein
MMKNNYKGLAFIGDISLSKKSHSNRVDDTYQALINKMTHYLDFCQENELMPVCLGNLFSKSTSFKVFWEVYQEFFESKLSIICLGDSTQDDIYRKLKEDELLTQSYHEITQKLGISVNDPNIDRLTYHLEQQLDTVGCSISLDDKDGEMVKYKIKIGKILRNKALDKNVVPSFICINLDGINEEHLPVDKEIFINKSDELNEFSFFAERLRKSATKKESQDENNLPHYIESVTESSNYDAFVISSIKSLYQDRDLS